MNALAESGYVARTGDPEDGRKAILIATGLGVALIAEARRRVHAWLNAQLRELSPAERRTLADATRIIRTIADS